MVMNLHLIGFLWILGPISILYDLVLQPALEFDHALLLLIFA